MGDEVGARVVEARIRAAHGHLAEGEAEEALAVLTRALFVAPNDGSIHALRAAVLELLGDLPAAAAAYAVAGSAYGAREAQVRYEEGVRCLEAGDARRGLVWLEGACELAPQHVGMAIHRAAAYVDLGANETAVEVASALISACEAETTPESTEGKKAGLAFRASLFQRLGRIHDAHTDVINLLRLDPDHRLGLALARKWDALQSSYRVDAAHHHLVGDLDGAAAALARAHELAPDDPTLVLRKAALARDTGDAQGALALLTALAAPGALPPVLAAEHGRLLALVHNDAGVALFGEGAYARAVRAFNKAVAACPAEPAYYINRGDAQREKGVLDLAIADYHTARELVDGMPCEQSAAHAASLALRLSVCHDALGTVEFTRTNYDHARLEFTTAIGLAPHVADYYVHRARTALQVKDLEAVRADLVAALALAPAHPEGRRMFVRFFPHHDLPDQ